MEGTSQTGRGTLLHLAERPDVAGREIRKARPWARVDVGFVQDDIGIYAPLTHAGTRAVNECLVPVEGEGPRRRPRANADQSYVDSQQLWTVLRERFRSLNDPSLSADSLNKVDAQLRNYLAFAEGPREPRLCQGLVLSIRLRPAAKCDDPWRASIAALLGIDPATPGPWSVYGVMVNHERYSLGALSPPALPLVTVVPLVRRPQNASELQAFQIVADGPLSPFTPIPGVLLTLDPRARTQEGECRVDASPPGIGRTVISAGARAELLRRVWRAIGLLGGVQ